MRSLRPIIAAALLLACPPARADWVPYACPMIGGPQLHSENWGPYPNQMTADCQICVWGFYGAPVRQSSKTATSQKEPKLGDVGVGWDKTFLPMYHIGWLAYQFDAALGNGETELAASYLPRLGDDLRERPTPQAYIDTYARHVTFGEVVGESENAQQAVRGIEELGSYIGAHPSAKFMESAQAFQLVRARLSLALLSHEVDEARSLLAQMHTLIDAFRDKQNQEERVFLKTASYDERQYVFVRWRARAIHATLLRVYYDLAVAIAARDAALIEQAEHTLEEAEARMLSGNCFGYVRGALRALTGVAFEARAILAPRDRRPALLDKAIAAYTQARAKLQGRYVLEDERLERLIVDAQRQDRSAPALGLFPYPIRIATIGR